MAASGDDEIHVNGDSVDNGMSDHDDHDEHVEQGADSGAASANGNTPVTQQALTVTQSRPRHPLYSLPSELILDIVDLLPPESFINFAFANYPLLHWYGVLPALSRTRVIYITTQTRIPALFPLLRIPAEIMLHILRNLRPIDIARFVVANYQDLARQGIAPPLTPETERELRNAVRLRMGR
ncbi:hypothetical protein CERZMDRAFT_90581 [Cercospora zeae-maydis SCOH1-5]|uniref:F-box domain-containing protein n=1 Tax=Cercospora zeae-maydis SCOH1-5 TaxID=717836 RepID=A0A6A6FIS0_9PEZI|nr:hypothetical protein CERZMDRAFT_90581 [Cercospora zeae-maydis SCOH1-5]